MEFLVDLGSILGQGEVNDEDIDRLKNGDLGVNQHRVRGSKDEMRLKGFHGSIPRQRSRGYGDLFRARDYKDSKKKKEKKQYTCDCRQEYYILPSLRALGQWDLIGTTRFCQCVHLRRSVVGTLYIHDFEAS